MTVPKPVAEGWWGSPGVGYSNTFWHNGHQHKGDKPAVVLLKTEYDRMVETIETAEQRLTALMNQCADLADRIVRQGQARRQHDDECCLGGQHD